MTWWQAAILGLVEGVTEYLPVSSTGHLVLTQRLLGIPESEAVTTYEICIQAGAIAAVFGVFSRRISAMVRGCVGRDPDGLRVAVRLVLAFAVTGAVGLVLETSIKKNLRIEATVVGWFVGGIVLIALDRWISRTAAAPGRKPLVELSLSGALAIGLAQCLAMWPGVSRSLVTLLAGLFAGLSFAAALEFSFLLGGITLLAVSGQQAVKHGDTLLNSYSPAAMTVGFVCATAAAVITVRWMLAFLNRVGLGVFGYYRVALAILVAIAIWQGWLGAGR